ncbi:hypothetical protein RFI_30048 [Reticulomyxa filosa]|uniref:Uncharacterized protein n=1 Tax=Reticulomyxa filosa TaxID=46433 RepID=X6M0D2_RETFI|nr:hypothetical protein RFI_30048 [Reticulomyxa filosa]|eukprot:ETO07344.1 hypothetical protein RFI_30048 [Reticulomyxa filosa]
MLLTIVISFLYKVVMIWEFKIICVDKNNLTLTDAIQSEFHVLTFETLLSFQTFFLETCYILEKYMPSFDFLFSAYKKSIEFIKKNINTNNLKTKFLFFCTQLTFINCFKVFITDVEYVCLLLKKMIFILHHLIKFANLIIFHKSSSIYDVWFNACLVCLKTQVVPFFIFIIANLMKKLQKFRFFSLMTLSYSVFFNPLENTVKKNNKKQSKTVNKYKPKYSKSILQFFFIEKHKIF